MRAYLHDGSGAYVGTAAVPDAERYPPAIKVGDKRYRQRVGSDYQETEEVGEAVEATAHELKEGAK